MQFKYETQTVHVQCGKSKYHCQQSPYPSILMIDHIKILIKKESEETVTDDRNHEGQHPIPPSLFIIKMKNE